MVQNTVGRIYLDNNPYSDIKEGMKYLVESDEPTPTDAIYRFDDIHDLRVADLACGSGHILNECFDLLYQIYIEEGYNRRRAVEDIFRYNLTGVDIDTRAKQLAMFALLLKACQKDRSFADGHVLPRVLDMPKAGLPLPADTRLANEIEAVNKTLADADTLGSIMKFNLSPAAREWVVSLGEENETAQLVLALTDKYAALIANPPYMGRGNMNSTLTAYLDKNYPIAKQDLFATFMQMMIERTQDKGRCAFITMESWMFLSSFEKLRHYIIDNFYISSLGHFGWHIIGIAFGTAMTVIEKNKDYGRIGEYSYLTIDDIDRSKNVPFVFPKKDNGRFAHVSQQNFEKIPGCPIGYWVSEKMIEVINEASPIDDNFKCREGLHTTDNKKYVRFWYEVAISKIALNCQNYAEVDENGTWVPYNKGGGFRRWFGLNECVVAFDKKHREEMAALPFHVRPSQDLYFKEGGTWSAISSGKFSIRYYPIGFLFDAGGQIAVGQGIKKLIGYLNSNVFDLIAKVTMPTINFKCGVVKTLPDLSSSTNEEIVNINISISKQDWDAHETSWDFEENELVRLAKEGLGQITATVSGEVAMQYYTLKLLVTEYKAYWAEQFFQLHANEEELNRQFIDVYNLQDELTPDVPLDEITILQQGEINIENGQIVWHDDVIVKQLISYAVGCMMGRYSLDCKGLILANQGDGQKEYEALVPNSRFAIDDDGIIPLMSVNNELTDHITLRFKAWLSVAFGEEIFMDNLNFVERALDKRLEDYFLKDFWKDHKKMYQNRPIYWLFSSKKGAFQCIVYMHRMNAYTAEKVRTKYLLPHIEWLMTKQAEMQANAANLSARERKELDNIGKQIDECREYHDRLHVIADRQIAFDLDDGVVVNYAKFGDVLAKLK